jgi:hypothetical protein
MADAAFILGFAALAAPATAAAQARHRLPHLLIDSILHGVFCAGPGIPVVENPALREAAIRPGRPQGQPSPG